MWVWHDGLQLLASTFAVRPRSHLTHASLFLLSESTSPVQNGERTPLCEDLLFVRTPRLPKERGANERRDRHLARV